MNHLVAVAKLIKPEFYINKETREVVKVLFGATAQKSPSLGIFTIYENQAQDRFLLDPHTFNRTFEKSPAELIHWANNPTHCYHCGQELRHGSL